MVDCPLYETDVRSTNYLRLPQWQVGGTAVLAARELKRRGFKPMILGGIGNDAYAEAISRFLADAGIDNLLYRNRKKPTGQCFLFYGSSGQRWIFVGREHANDYDLNHLSNFLNETAVGSDDIVLLCTHFIERLNSNHCRELMWLVRDKGAKVVVDLVPHHLYKKVDMQTVSAALEPGMDMLIAEFKTLTKLFARDHGEYSPSSEDWRRIFAMFRTRLMVLRYGRGDIERQDVLIRDENGQPVPLQVGHDTGYSSAEKAWKLGFGDRLTAELLNVYGAEL